MNKLIPAIIQKAYYILLIFLILLLVIFAGCSPKREFHQYSFFCMGTVFQIKLQEKNTQLAEKVEQMCTELSSKLNLYDSTSLLTEINHSKKIQLDPTTCSVIHSALRWYKLSGGKFDPTVAPLTLLWDFNSDNPKPPSENKLTETLHLVGANKIGLEHCVIQKPQELQLDLGGIAKGFAVDFIYDTLLAYTHQPFFIDAGGNIRVYGKDFRIGIQHPRNKKKIIASFTLKSTYACATSGDYQRMFTYRGKRYHHIIDPQTGYPVSHNTASVTVIAPTATDADGASTSVFVMGENEGLQFLKKQPDLEGVIIQLDKRGKIDYLITDHINNFKEVQI